MSHPRLIALGADSPAELAALVTPVTRELEASPHPGHHTGPGFALTRGRGPYRLATLATPERAAPALALALEAHRRLDPRPRFHPPEVAFVFPGQGSQRPGMGHELIGLPPFDAALETLDTHLAPHLRAPLAEVWLSGDLDETHLTQPATLALSIALAETLRALGVVPTAALGHSVGEIGAAWLAGCLELPDALTLVATRARLMASLPERGAMALIRASAPTVEPLLATNAALAAANGPTSTVVSGPADAVALTLERAHARGLDSRPLPISQASHCALLDPILGPLERAAAALPHRAPALPLAAALHGTLFGRGPAPDAPDASYWRRQAREPVRFASAVAALADRGVELFIELAPEPSFARLELTPHAPWLAPLARHRPGLEPLLELLAELWRRGADLDLDRVSGPLATPA